MLGYKASMNFWDHHGIFFLVAITFFPRLTLIFSSVPFGGFFWWLGFFFMPRLLVAILATMTYLDSNPVLVYISWVVALFGEVFEKIGLRKKGPRRFVFRSYQTRPQEKDYSTHQKLDDSGTIEAEFTKK